MKNDPTLFSTSNKGSLPKRERPPRIYPTVSDPIISSSHDATYDLEVIGRITPEIANNDYEAEVPIGCCIVS